MSTSSYVVKQGDVLLIPLASANTLAPLSIVWQQNLSDKQGSYHTGLVQVKEKRKPCSLVPLVLPLITGFDLYSRRAGAVLHPVRILHRQLLAAQRAHQQSRSQGYVASLPTKAAFP